MLTGGRVDDAIVAFEINAALICPCGQPAENPQGLVDHEAKPQR
jgi:hypothetical protein